MKTTTLVYVFNTQWQILLSAKKKSDSWFTISIGKRNGAGGKIDDGESPIEWAKRELLEEVGIDLPIEQFQYAGYLDFKFPSKPERDHDNHIYVISNYDGPIFETEEMLPKRWNIEDIPYNQMRDDDKLRMPKMLAWEIVNECYVFDDNGKMIA